MCVSSPRSCMCATTKAKSSGSRKEWHQSGRRFMMKVTLLLRKARLMQLEETEQEPVHSLGYAVGLRGGAAQCIGATEVAEEAGGRTVFESGKRKHSQIDSCSDTEQFWGPQEGHVEKRAVKPIEVSRFCSDMAGYTEIKTTLQVTFLNCQFEGI
ncbi:uncharacterized protein LOC111866712 [Cryptotermes secundus]|uniref:uncharacterized protein LOC111866712 n=1 Tax=Cryptotermes secundus TaxID=105785 RepID=UPI000CD7D229|nr:uncharacterized protein LOC111866712 [Cryptotermes secundus]XP_023711696.1 uncharacterized protein LOC111866712 [Cryptotermes secundus]XP_033608312.1 uncharacterized protein LOC111866712 [Cryptotermes secundus]